MEVKAASVIAFVFRKHEGSVQFLMMRRTKERGGFWQSVSGTVKGRETAAQTAMREVEEETGLHLKRYLLVDAVNIFYKEAEDTVYVEPVFGIEVVEGKVQVSKEHMAYRWSAPEEALSLLPFESNKRAFRALCRLLEIALPDEKAGDAKQDA